MFCDTLNTANRTHCRHWKKNANCVEM